MPSCGICPSVTFVYSVETNKHIFKDFHHWVASPFESFCSNLTAVFWPEPPNEGIECKWGGQKHDSQPISGFRINDWVR